MQRSTRPHLSRRALLSFGLCLLPLGLGLGIHGLTRGQQHAMAATISGVDPRLILHPQTVPVAGVLPGGVQVAGILHPGLPGPNTLELRASIAGRPLSGGAIVLTATMPGMRMLPARATLSEHSGLYSGSVALPMFGRYQTQISLNTPSGRRTGTIVLSVPLSLKGNLR